MFLLESRGLIIVDWRGPPGAAPRSSFSSNGIVSVVRLVMCLRVAGVVSRWRSDYISVEVDLLYVDDEESCGKPWNTEAAHSNAKSSSRPLSEVMATATATVTGWLPKRRPFSAPVAMKSIDSCHRESHATSTTLREDAIY